MNQGLHVEFEDLRKAMSGRLLARASSSTVKSGREEHRAKYVSKYIYRYIYIYIYIYTYV